MRVRAADAGWPLIRAARPADLPALEAMLRRTMPVDYAGIIPPAVMASRVDEMVAALKGRWPLVLTAVAGGRAAGVALVRDGMHLSLVWVDSSFRTQGVGSRLLDAVEDWTRSRGGTGMTLNVYRDNAAAVRFYERRGWAVAREYVGLVGRVMLVMAKEL
ncbi:GNAT family N-acetyltransferase [Desulfocurvus sp. DL9XJH121]